MSKNKQKQQWKLFLSVGALFLALATYFMFHLFNTTPDYQVTIIHPFSYSNAAVFQASIDDPEFWQRRAVADTSKHADILRSEGNQKPIIAVTPFTNALIAASADKSIRIIGGAGLNGLYIVASKDYTTLDSLVGKTIGTARADSLEVMLQEAMKSRDFKTHYFDDPFVAIESLTKGKLDAITHVEPFVTQLTQQGMNRILASSKLWGDHPDAILVTTEEVLLKFPDVIEAALRKLQAAEIKVNSDPAAAAKILAPLYAPVTPEQLTAILPKQQARIDISNYLPFFRERFKTLKKLKYIREDQPFPESAFDLTLLKKVVK